MTSPANSQNPPNDSNGRAGLSVGELSKRTGVTTAAINYYVRIGVLPPPRKTSQTRALYPSHFEALIFKIKELQAAGLNLKGIKQVVNGDPTSPLAAAMPAAASSFAAASAPAGPVSIEDFLSQSGLDYDLYDNLVSAGLIRRPRTGPDGAPAHDRRDLTAARAFARFADAGIEYPLLERHTEYSPLSKAEALFLAEHLSSATRSTPSTQPGNLVVAFDVIRRYLRHLELEEVYPDWRKPQG